MRGRLRSEGKAEAHFWAWIGVVARGTFRGWDSTEKAAALLPHSKSAVDDGFEVGFAAEDEGRANYLNELFAAKIGEETGDRFTR
jgi:hypothetical protein